MGHNWLQVFSLDWQEIFVLQSTEHSPVQPILQKYPNVFQEGLGTLTDFKAKIIVDPAAPPDIHRPQYTGIGSPDFEAPSCV